MDEMTILMHLNYRDLVRKYGIAIMQGYRQIVDEISLEKLGISESILLDLLALEKNRRSAILWM